MNKIPLKRLYEKTCTAHQKGQRFVLFRKPHGKKLQLYIDNSKATNKRKYFLISSLDHEEQIRICPDKTFYAKINKPTLSENKCFSTHCEKPEAEYLEMLEKALLELKSARMQKVVLSRVKKIDFEKIFLKKSFQNLIMTYPGAFVYLWNDTKHGLWIGATPELLLKSKSNYFQTVALAATLRVAQDQIQWSMKEVEEHHMVVNYIQKTLQNHQANIFIGNTKSSISGQIKHLKTPVDFSFKKQPDINRLIQDLHPTPAVCGLPKNTALEFIKKNEHYPRNFYTGYLGVFSKETIALYVNLRCARIYKKEIEFYAGGGITAQSDPCKEWTETQLKMENILSQLVFTSSLNPSAVFSLSKSDGKGV